jgi:hypothetical protein
MFEFWSLYVNLTLVVFVNLLYTVCCMHVCNGNKFGYHSLRGDSITDGGWSKFKDIGQANEQQCHLHE